MQNGYIESFNGKCRDECLDEHWFQTLPQARQIISDWRRDYDEVRQDGTTGRIPPAQPPTRPTRSSNRQHGLQPKHWYGESEKVIAAPQVDERCRP